MEVKFEEHTLIHIKRVECLKVLGTQVQMNGGIEAGMGFRVSKIWNAYFRYRDLLENRKVLLRKRVAFLNLLMVAVGGWCIDSWTPTKSQLSRLNGVQATMVRRMLRLGRPSGSDDTLYFRIVARIFKGLRKRHEILKWDALVRGQLIDWGGHTGHLRCNEPDQLTAKVATWGDWCFLQKSVRFYGRQGHPKRFNAWRWETPFRRFAETKELDTWFQSAAQKRSQCEQKNELHAWISSHP